VAGFQPPGDSTAFVLNGQEVSPGFASANQGRWWLVAPSGRLFFSLGVDVSAGSENRPGMGTSK